MKTKPEQCVWYFPAQILKEFGIDSNERKESQFNYQDVGCMSCSGNNKNCDRYSKADGYLLSRLNTNTSSKVKHNRRDSYEDEERGIFY